MNAGEIWWGQIGNSLRLLTTVTNNLREGRSAVLQVPRNLPWRQDFYEAAGMRCAMLSAERRLARLRWDAHMGKPGEFILDELCPDVRGEYWPGMTYARYLGSLEDHMLNVTDVWVTGIGSKKELALWEEFVAEYEQTARDPDARAVFILEYDGDRVESSRLALVDYTVENYDCRVFALEAAAALGNTRQRNYQAELALSICRNDPELCHELLQTGEKLLHNPVKTAAEVITRSCSSEGWFFAEMDDEVIQSAAWEAAIVLLFPVMERYRMRFIARYKEELSRHLPINNSNGERVKDPSDLEIGSLFYIVSNSAREFAPDDARNITLCREVRNLLAHNKIVPLEDVCKVYALKTEA